MEKNSAQDVSESRAVGRSPVRVNRDDVFAAYRGLLSRDPESEAAVAARVNRDYSCYAEFLETFVRSAEFRNRVRPRVASEFFFSILDAKNLILRHEDKSRSARPDCFVNFLGVATKAAYIDRLSSLAGQVEAPPIPSNCHAEMVEWAAALRAVELARERFVVVELGAGWGCWLVNTIIAAKRLGLAAYGIGVEGDEGHVEFLREHCENNGVEKSEYEVRKVVAGAKSGVALFPVMADSSKSYGQEPQFFSSRRAAASFQNSSNSQWSVTPIQALETVISDKRRVDLLHIDIQGGELDLVKGSMSVLRNKVAYIVIGTHSRAIDGELIAALRGAGWILEFEKPTTFVSNAAGELVTTLDGTQGWRNPWLTARAA